MALGSRPRARPLLTGLSIGFLVMGTNYLVHALGWVQLLPEQAGYLFLRVLPLRAFSALLQVLGVLARPLLLLSTTMLLVALLTAATIVVERVLPRWKSLALAFFVAGMTAVISLAAAEPGVSVSAMVPEVALLAVVTVLAHAARASTLHPADGLREERRELLRNLFFGVVGLSVLGIAYADLRRFIGALTIREGSRAVTEVTPVADFYVISKNLTGDPVVAAPSWRLVLPDGRGLTYEQLLAMPSRELELTLACISNEVGGTLISNGIWRGPRVQDLLALAPVPSNATFLLIESADRYTESFPLGELTEDSLLATHLNGQPLTAVHGFPARLIFPGHYGMKQPKWVTRLKVSSRDEPGYWEQHGWDQKAIVKTMSRIDAPPDGTIVAAGTVRFSGIAFAGARRISAVELSWDRASWHKADPEREFSPYAWRFWQLEAVLGPGQYLVRVRARDGRGDLQGESPVATLPSGAEGLHRISLVVR